MTAHHLADPDCERTGQIYLGLEDGQDIVACVLHQGTNTVRKDVKIQRHHDVNLQDPGVIVVKMLVLLRRLSMSKNCGEHRALAALYAVYYAHRSKRDLTEAGAVPTMCRIFVCVSLRVES